MPTIPKTSDTAILQRFFDLTGEKPNAVLSKALSAHVALVEELVPQASVVRAAAEAEMELARRTALGGDIEAIYKAAASGDSFDQIQLGDNPMTVAEERLEESRRFEVGYKKAAKAAADFVGVCAREPAAKMMQKMEKAYQKVTVDLDPEKTTMAEAAAAEGLAEILIRVMYQVAVIVENPANKHERGELRQAYEAKPAALPRLQDIRDRLNTEDKARRDKENRAAAKAAQARAQMSGSAVSTGRMDLTEAEKASAARNAAHRSGHVEEVVETDGVEVAV